MQTGRSPGGGVTYPAIGALLSMLKGGNVQHHLPPYVALSTCKGRFSECGFLGERFAPFATGGNPAAAKFMVDGYTPVGGASKEEMERRFHLLNELDTFGRQVKGHPALAEFDRQVLKQRLSFPEKPPEYSICRRNRKLFGNDTV